MHCTYSCNKITKTWIQIFHPNWFVFSQILAIRWWFNQPPRIVYISKSKWYKHHKIKKFPLNLQLQKIQILTNNVEMLLLCLSYFITTVPSKSQIPTKPSSVWQHKSLTHGHMDFPYREESHMTSDGFWVFLNYLPTLIRYFTT